VGSQGFLKIDNLAQWKSSDRDVPKAELWIPQGLHELRDAWPTYPDRPVAEVTSEAQSYAARAAAANLLWSTIQTATTQWSSTPTKLGEVCTALDDVALPQTLADLERYRKDLTAVLLAGTKLVTMQLVVDQKAPQSPIAVKISDLRAKIREMTALYQVIVWTVVFVTGYLSFYSGHPAFGTLADYLAVFLWALGLTTTGTQIISRVHKP